LGRLEKFIASLQIYHKYLYKGASFTFCLPWLMAFGTFYTWYVWTFKNLPIRIRKKRLVESQILILKYLALIIIFPNMMVVITYGKFENEFLRISVSVAAGMHIYYCYIHFLVRILSILSNIFVITAIEYWYLRESLM
jgi:hypothetical protein